MKRIRNLHRITAVVVWRAYHGEHSGHGKETHDHPRHAIETQAGPSQERHDH